MQKISFFLCVTLAAISCASEPKEILPTATDLVGHWEIVAGKRDSTTTQMLNGKTFDFSATEISTLLPMNEADSISTSSFSFDGDSIVCPKFTANFKVVALKNDTMTLFTRLQNHQFMLTLVSRNTSPS
jgi:hypothetical protein